MSSHSGDDAVQLAGHDHGTWTSTIAHSSKFQAIDPRLGFGICHELPKIWSCLVRKMIMNHESSFFCPTIISDTSHFGKNEASKTHADVKNVRSSLCGCGGDSTTVVAYLVQRYKECGFQRIWKNICWHTHVLSCFCNKGSAVLTPEPSELKREKRQL